MQTISIIGIFLVGLAVLAVVFLLLYGIGRRRLKKKWEAEQREFAETGTVPKMRNHDSLPTETVTILVCMAIFLIVSVVSCRYMISLVEDQLTLTERNLKNEISELQDALSRLEQWEKKEASALEEVNVYALPESYDADAHTVDVKIDVIPKRLTDALAVSLACGTMQAQATREGNIYTATVTRSIFEPLSDGVTALLDYGDETVTETVDSAAFPTVKMLCGDWMSLFYPTFVSLGLHGTGSFENGEYRANFRAAEVLLCKPEYGTSDVTACSFFVEVNGAVGYELDLSDRMVTSEEYKTIEIALPTVSLTFPCGEDGVVVFGVRYSVSDGTQVVVRTLTETGNVRHFHRSCEICDAAGNLLLKTE